ncbi:MAG: hypothetical protein ACSHXB_01750 [Sulfitobacter sp.]
MMSNNKILTVSYGTFSCTLEGFDDSFGTMKAIAEYFRGLSSDAPYFGAEPPQPDAEMLARIAQKEISRRVEAREHEGKIHLSAIEAQNEGTGDAPQALLSDTAGTTTPIAESAMAAAAIAVGAAGADAKDQDDAPAAAPVEDKAEARVEVETPVAEHSEAKAVEPTVEAIEEDTKAEAELEEFVEDENDIVPGQPDADVEAFFANSTEVRLADDENEEFEVDQVAAKPEPVVAQNDSIAAKLQRIRAVVAQHDEIQDEEDFAEDQHADNSDEPTAEPEHLVADARRDIEDALTADDTADMDVADHDEDDDDDIAAILDRLGAADDVEVETVDEDIVAVSQPTDAADDAVSNLFGEDGYEDNLEADADNDVEADTDDVAEVAAAEEAPRTPRARVIKVKRADLEAAIENGELEEYDEDIPTLDELAPAKTKTSSLSKEDEAELARELADLEADMSPKKARLSDDLDDALDHEDAILDDEDDVDEEAQTVAPAPRRVLPSIDDAKSDDMDRLLAETDHQMDEPESATRRNAFSHLRAAVAAKKADVAMGASEKADENDGAYRNDLADVVRPRRPVSTLARTERPGEGRPAPLKLVAEQRIDVERARPAGPVRPRRVAAVSDVAAPAAEGESFADYAAEMGATKLPQLLEAAAAYMSFVEGREQFSRPQLMTKVRQVGPEDGFSREDGLRSFGQLLRAGKIEKIKGGRFTVSDDIGYRPDHRAAG